MQKLWVAGVDDLGSQWSMIFHCFCRIKLLSSRHLGIVGVQVSMIASCCLSVCAAVVRSSIHSVTFEDYNMIVDKNVFS